MSYREEKERWRKRKRMREYQNQLNDFKNHYKEKRETNRRRRWSRSTFAREKFASVVKEKYILNPGTLSRRRRWLLYLLCEIPKRRRLLGGMRRKMEEADFIWKLMAACF